METEVTSEASYYKNIENVYGLLNVEQIEMEFGYSLIPLADEGNGGNLLTGWLCSANRWPWIWDL